MTEALKPCPFCGGEAGAHEDYGHSTAWYVGCSNGKCPVEPHVWKKSKAEAISAWNTRADLVDPAAIREAALECYYARQIEWSRQTFGPALRTMGIIEHITKELAEIAADPHDLSEWVDVVILAMDGFWRHGGKAETLMPALLAKQAKNMARTWPDWRNHSEDQAIEHDRSGEARNDKKKEG